MNHPKYVRRRAVRVLWLSQIAAVPYAVRPCTVQRGQRRLQRPQTPVALGTRPEHTSSRWSAHRAVVFAVPAMYDQWDMQLRRQRAAHVTLGRDEARHVAPLVKSVGSSRHIHTPEMGERAEPNSASPAPAVRLSRSPLRSLALQGFDS